MGIDSNFIQWLRLKMNQETERCHSKIEFCLIRTFSEVKKSQMRDVKLAESFNDRLFARLSEIPDEKETVTGKFLENFLLNKRLNYALAGSLAAIIAITIAYNSDLSQNFSEPSGVVQGNTRFIDQPSSQHFMTTVEETEFINGIKQKPDNLRLLQELEKYYLMNHKKQTAAEIREVINLVR